MQSAKYKIYTYFDKQTRKYQGCVKRPKIDRNIVNRWSIAVQVRNFKKEAFTLFVAALREQKEHRMQEAEKRAQVNAMCDMESPKDEPEAEDTPMPSGPRSYARKASGQRECTH